MTTVVRRPALVVWAIIVLTGCSRQQPVQLKQDSGPIAVRTAPVVTREMRRVVESVGTLFPMTRSSSAQRWRGRSAR